MLDKLYADIGSKVKGLAKWGFVVEAVGTAIGGIFFLIEEEFLYGFLLLILGPLAAWAGSWILYAFGELVEKACHMDQNLAALAAPSIQQQRQLQKEALEKKRQEAEARRRQAEEQTKQQARERALQQAEEQARREAEAQAGAAAPEPKQAAVPPAEKNLAEQLAYALRYQTDDGMIHHLESIDDPLVKNILREPRHLIRGLVEEALKSL